MIASVFLAFFNNLTFLFGTCYPGNTTDDMFVSSIFDSIKVVKTHSLTLGMQNLFVLIVFIFVMHDYLSREILNQGVYALVRMHRRTKWLVRRMAGLAVICAVYMGIYLTIVYELSSYYVHKRLVIPHSAVLPKAWLALFMMVYFAAFIFMDLQYMGQTVFKSLNKKKQAIFFSLLRKVFIVVPLTYLMPYALHMGTDGVFLAEPVSNVIGGSLCFITMLALILPELKRMEKQNMAK